MAIDLGLLEDAVRARVTFDCVEAGIFVAVVSATDSEARDTLSVNAAGADGKQARWFGWWVVRELGVRERVGRESVPIEWVRDGERLVGCVAE